MKEIWKDVIGHKGIYSISNFGRVRSERTKQGTLKGMILKNMVNRKGYYFIDLLGKSRTIHSIVAESFIGIKPNGMTINHKDCIKSNNHPSNLEYISNLENMRHAFRNGRFKNVYHPRGEDSASSKITEKQVKYIRKNHIPYKVSFRELGDKFGISASTVAEIVRYQIWKHI